MTVATAIVATLALPGAGISPAANAQSNATAEALAQLQATESQTLSLATAAEGVVDASRGEYTATSAAEVRRIQLAPSPPRAPPPGAARA